MINTTFTCVSVLGGWQTAISTKEQQVYTFGPVFNNFQDLWAWQKKNV